MSLRLSAVSSLTGHSTLFQPRGGLQSEVSQDAVAPRTLQVNVLIGLGWNLAIVGAAAFGLLGAAGAMVAALLHNFSTLLVLSNSGRLLRYDERDVEMREMSAYRAGIQR